MKNPLLLTLLLFFLFHVPGKGKAKPGDGKIYYFCHSQAKAPLTPKEKQVAFYTEIMEEPDTREFINKQLNAYYEQVKKKCENASGCTSDLDRYPTYEWAKQEFDNMRKKYSDTSVFTVKKLEL